MQLTCKWLVERICTWVEPGINLRSQMTIPEFRSLNDVQGQMCRFHMLLLLKLLRDARVVLLVSNTPQLPVPESDNELARWEKLVVEIGHIQAPVRYEGHR